MTAVQRTQAALKLCMTTEKSRNLANLMQQLHKPCFQYHFKVLTSPVTKYDYKTILDESAKLPEFLYQHFFRVQRHFLNGFLLSINDNSCKKSFVISFISFFLFGSLEIQYVIFQHYNVQKRLDETCVIYSLSCEPTLS